MHALPDLVYDPMQGVEGKKEPWLEGGLCMGLNASRSIMRVRSA